MQFRCQIYIIFLYAQCSYLMWSAILGSFQKKTDLLLTRKAKLNCCEFLASYGAFFQSDIPSYFKTPVCDALLSYFFMLFRAGTVAWRLFVGATARRLAPDRCFPMRRHR